MNIIAELLQCSAVTLVTVVSHWLNLHFLQFMASLRKLTVLTGAPAVCLCLPGAVRDECDAESAAAAGCCQIITGQCLIEC